MDDGLDEIARDAGLHGAADNGACAGASIGDTGAISSELEVGELGNSAREFHVNGASEAAADRDGVLARRIFTVDDDADGNIRSGSDESGAAARILDEIAFLVRVIGGWRECEDRVGFDLHLTWLG